MKKISILGSTGSIGVNALNVIRKIPEKFQVMHLTGNMNTKKMIAQGKEFLPASITMVDIQAAEIVEKALKGLSIEIYSGRDKLLDLAGDKNVDLLLNALVGASGMEPTLKALENGVDVALGAAVLDGIVACTDLLIEDLVFQLPFFELVFELNSPIRFDAFWYSSYFATEALGVGA